MTINIFRCAIDLRICYTPCRFHRATNRKRCEMCEPVTLEQLKEDAPLATGSTKGVLVGP